LGRLEEGDAIHIVKFRDIRTRGVKPRGGVKPTNTYYASVNGKGLPGRAASMGTAQSAPERR